MLTFGLLALGASVGNFSSFRSIEHGVLERSRQKEKEHLAGLAERERIGRDLHDLLGHTLSVIVLKSELASRLADRDPARAVQEIREVEAISRHALSEVRQAVRGYRGSGLLAELGRAKVALDAAGIGFEYQGSPLSLSPDHERTLELIVREAITNVVRHSRARACRTLLERRAGGLHLEFFDDGLGWQGAEGSGLSAMRERLRAHGGTLELHGSAGTRLVIFIPEPRSRAAPSEPPPLPA